MKTLKIGLLAGLASLSLAPAAFAQAGPTTTANANASAEIVQPISINCTAMNFGRLAPLSTASATVTVPPQGTPIVDGSNIVVPGTQTTATPTNCTVTGELNANYTVTPPSAMTLSNGTTTMPLAGFAISQELDGNPLSRQLSNLISGDLGFDGFGVGATLTVGANQAPGLYTGSFVVAVQYQ